HIVGALGPARRLAGRLDRGEQQCDQHGNDRDDDQELDQREAERLSACKPLLGSHWKTPRTRNKRWRGSARNLTTDSRTSVVSGKPGAVTTLWTISVLGPASQQERESQGFRNGATCCP